MDKTPVKMIPAFKDYLWGGRRLIDNYNKNCNMDKAAESWELSTHPDGESVVAEGKYENMKLSEYISANSGCIGDRAEKFDNFPILIKLIDAYDNLSVQVHPDDEYALKIEKEYGKTEMWYILECDEGATLYYGVNRELTADELKHRIENNTVLEVLNKVHVKKGDVFFIEAGTIHAIGKGIVICEIQQNSNTTYRIYDYNRRDKAGKPRELHIEKALQVTKLSPQTAFLPDENDKNLLAKCKYFTVYSYNVNGCEKVKTDCGSFRALTVTDGNITLNLNDNMIAMKKGDTVFVPAQDGVMNFTGLGTVIVSYV